MTVTISDSSFVSGISSPSTTLDNRSPLSRFEMEGAPENVVNAPVPPQPAPVDQNNQPEQVGNGNGNLANENS
ncbi:unnamed protein product [Linum tenue]|uniref:Uncharacterized protein n=1 Tax=Linum tenue TaxID=586396 RepID=A0AAV0Q241_9ROSI|nr:unnamed protein product [Linum tenue]